MRWASLNIWQTMASTLYLRWSWPAMAGTVAAALLAGLYVAVVAVEQNWSHAVGLLSSDGYFVAAIAASFGVQVGLFVHLRRDARASPRAPTALTGAGTGTSTVATLLCCAPHVTNLLPLIGLSGAAVFLTNYRVPFLLLGVAINVAGIGVMVRLVRNRRCGLCDMGRRSQP